MAKRHHSYDTGRIRRAGEQPVLGSEPFTAPARTKKKPGRAKKRVLLGLLIFVLLAAVLLGGAFIILSRVLDPGAFGIIGRQTDGVDYMPRDYTKKDVLHLLVVGIDNEEGRNYGEGLGMTDMILYCQYDLRNNKLNMLQIPRDSYVGESYATGGTGKINALLISGPDKDNPIQNLSNAIEELFRLPVDHYIAIDMDAMKTIVDILGPLRVYVPQEMNYAGSYLPQGWQWLDGDAAEFFVRNRYGPGFERSDIDRLDNQRHFYSALFRRFLNLAPADIVKLLPVFEYYCNTDIGLTDIFDIAFSALRLRPEDVLFCKVPGATGPELDPSGRNRSLYFVDLYGRGTEQDPGLATLLNNYFRAYSAPHSAEELGLPKIQIPGGYTLYPPNIQGMADVQEDEGGADIDVEPRSD